MSVKIVIVGLIGGAFALTARLVPFPATSALNNSQVASASSLKEFNENGAAYFPPGSSRMPNGSPDDHFGYSIAWYLHEIGEPPLSKSAENSEAHAYRLIRIGFPIGQTLGQTLVVRLQIENDGAAKLFVKKNLFNGKTFLLKRDDSVPISGVGKFLERVTRGTFWQLPAREKTEPDVPDASYWYLEGVQHGNYQVVYRRAPELKAGGFVEIGRYLAEELARLDW